MVTEFVIEIPINNNLPVVPVIAHKLTHWSNKTLNKTCFGASDCSVHSFGTFRSADSFRRRRGCDVTRFPQRVGFSPGKMATVTTGKRKKWPLFLE